jgi:transcription elongation factor Elf1
MKKKRRVRVVWCSGCGEWVEISSVSHRTKPEFGSTSFICKRCGTSNESVVKKVLKN